MSDDYPRDPDDLYGDTVVAKLLIEVRRNGACSVKGNIGDKAYAHALLAAAREAVNNHHAHMKTQLIIPQKDLPAELR